MTRKTQRDRMFEWVYRFTVRNTECTEYLDFKPAALECGATQREARIIDRVLDRRYFSGFYDR